jgi:hypothetical protein
MNIKNAPVRLFEAINIMQQGIRNYCRKFTEGGITMGLYVISPKRAFIAFPTTAILDQIEKKARDHFAHMNPQVIYCRYFVPPALPVLSSANIGIQTTINDYQINFSTALFDKAWERETVARALIYCPSENSMGEWKDWFSPQVSATMFTPLLAVSLMTQQGINEVSKNLAQPAGPQLDAFISAYALNDDDIPIGYRKKPWKSLYPEIAKSFDDVSTVYETYLLVRSSVMRFRHSRIKVLLEAYIKSVEDIVNDSQMHKAAKTQILSLMRGKILSAKGGYQAKRPAVILSDIECAQMLHALIKQFSLAPKKHQVLGEIILFIWLAQHCAFNDVVVKIDDILALKVTEVLLQEQEIVVHEEAIPLPGGLANILEAWIGDKDRVNKRLLLPSLTRDNLEDNLAKYSKKLFGADWQLQPKDFLKRVHVLYGARIVADVGDQLDYQQNVVGASPYQVTMQGIKKDILKALP